MAQSKRNKVGVTKEDIVVEEQVILEVLVELIDTTHLLTQQESFMHLNIP